jgi:hypothetical protein
MGLLEKRKRGVKKNKKMPEKKCTLNKTCKIGILKISVYIRENLRMVKIDFKII